MKKLLLLTLLLTLNIACSEDDEGCAATEFRQNGACVSREKTCDTLPLNALTGIQTWNGSWSSCQITTCNSSSTLIGNACILNACPTGMHLEGGTCINNSQACSSPNAQTAITTWDGANYGPCVPTICNSGYDLYNQACVLSCGVNQHRDSSGVCESNFRTCAVMPPNATSALEAWSNGVWGTCQITACGANYSLQSNECVVDKKLVRIAKASGQGTVNGGAGLFCGPSCTNAEIFLDYGSELIFTYIEQPGYRFQSWAGACASAGNNPICNLTVDTNKTIEIVFEPIEVIMQVVGNGSVSGDGGINCPSTCQRTLPDGTNAIYVATPQANHELVSFIGCDNVIGNECHVLVNDSKNITATFAPIEHNLSITKNGKGIITGVSGSSISCGATCSEDILQNTNVILSVAPDINWSVVNWTGCDLILSGQCHVQMTTARTISIELTSNEKTYCETEGPFNDFSWDSGASVCICDPTLNGTKQWTWSQAESTGSCFTNCSLGFFKENGQCISQSQMVTDINLSKKINIAIGKGKKTITDDGRLFFASHLGAKSTSGGGNLWVSDGTEEGTYLVKKFDNDSKIEDLRAIGNVVYFSADDGIHGEELWISDGTPLGTYMVQDINPGPASSSPREFTHITGNKIIFSAYREGFGREPYVSEGTNGSTTILANLNLTAGVSSNPNGFINFNGKVYFGATSHLYGREPFFTDGTPLGTQVLADIGPGLAGGAMEFPLANFSFFEFKDNLYFIAGDITTGLELWKSDGTSAGTALFASFNSGSGHGFPHGTFTPSIAFNGDFMVFYAFHPTTGAEVWNSNGTPGGTGLLRDWSSRGDNTFGRITTTENYIYYEAWSTAHGRELFFSYLPNPGSNSFAIADLNAGTAGSETLFMEEGVDENMYFISKNLTTNMYRLYSTDLPFSGTSMDNLINLFNFSDYLFDFEASLDVDLFSYDNSILFSYKEKGPTGNLFERINTKKVNPITHEITDFSQMDLTNSAFENPFTNHKDEGIVLNGVFYFAADDGVNGVELWRSDGSMMGTLLLSDIMAGAIGSHPHDFIILNDLVYFKAKKDGVVKTFSTDGNTITEYNTVNYDINNYTIFENVLVGSIPNVGGNDFVITNGTDAGTFLFNKHTSQDAEPMFYEVFENRLYMSINVSPGGRGLYRLNIAKNNIEQVGTVNTPRNLYVYDDKLFFTALKSGGGRDVFYTNGITVSPLHVVATPSQHAFMDENFIEFDPSFQEVNGRLLFVAFLPAIGTEIFMIHEGDLPTAITDICAGPCSSVKTIRDLDEKSNNPFLKANGNKTLAYFSAQESTDTGYELFKTDGNFGAIPMGEIWIGPNSSNPQNFFNIGQYTYFTAKRSDGTIGFYRTSGTTIGGVNGISIDTYEDLHFYQVINNGIYLSFNHPSLGAELWRIDNISPVGQVVRDLYEGPGSSYPSKVYDLGSVRLHIAWDEFLGFELFKLN